MPHYLTQEGLEKLKKELEELKTVRRREVIDRIQAARELGDLSENAEYSDAKDEQSFIEGRIEELEALIKKAEIIDSNNHNGAVSLGSTVKVVCNGDSEKEYKIVGSNEADPLKGLISNESPLGGAFLGKKVGETIEVEVPRGKMVCKIININ